MIRNNMDSGNLTGLILLDLQKAFDTVNHDILLRKLSAPGISDSATSWCRSYLTGRGQFVDLSGVSSPTLGITSGVPQGSILGPLLFLLYVNDMVTAIDAHCKLFIYADDSILAVSGNKIADIESILSKNMGALSD